MDIFNCRSPYIIPVNYDTTQVATKMELFIWKIGASEPTTPTKTIEKTKYSDMQYVNYYNISPFVYDIINTLISNEYAYNVRYKSYYKTTGDYTLLEDVYLVGVNGYNAYNNPNYSNTTDVAVLTNYGSKLNYIYDVDGYMMPSVDVLIDFTATPDDITMYYTTLEFVEDHYETYHNNIDFINDDTLRIFRIGMIQPPTAGIIVNTNFKISNGSGDVYFECDLTPICEQKYTPLSLQFINRLGGLQQMTLFKNSTKSIEVKASDYNTNTFTAGYPSYDQNLGQKRIFNKNGTTMVKANTGWLNESENINIQDIFLSEVLYLTSADANFQYGAVTLKSTSQLMKTHLNEKVINYELEFEVASSLINNVV